MADAPNSKALNPSKGGSNRTRALVLLLVPVLFFTYIFFLDMNLTLNDPDIWWHLKTGEYVVNNWEVPDVDPFSYTAPRPLSQEQKIGMRSQWLGQVIFYSSDMLGGLAGVVVLRNLLIILPAVILLIWLVRRGFGPWASLAVVSFSALILSLQVFYAFERPQGLSFSIVLLAVILLERIRRKSQLPGKDVSYLLLPALMAVWSNVHAGFIVGNIIIVIYFASELLRAVYHKLRGTGGAPVVRPVYYAVCAASILASFLNPNTYHLFYSYFVGLASMFISDFSRSLSGGGDSWVRNVVLEFKPLHYFYTELHYDWLLFYWVFTALLYVFMLVKYAIRKSFDMAEFVTVSLVVVFANFYARGLMFSLTVMPLYMGKTALELKQSGARFKSLGGAAVAVMLMLSIGFTTYSYKKTPQFLTPGISDRWVTPWYPTLLVEFLEQNPIDPPMYNYYTWGGYLIWTLYPKYQVFIDGRAIDNLINLTADSILKIYPGWREQLEAYNINFVAIPVIFRESGHIIPLATALAYDDEWKLVFVKNNSVIFVRDVPKNRHIIERYERDKDYVFLEILKLSNLLLVTNPNNPVFHLSRADALYALGKVDEANQIYSMFPEQARERRAHQRYIKDIRPIQNSTQ